MTSLPRGATVFFSAGEPSGDMHGANLIRALRQLDPALQAVGYGGPQMAQAGCHLHADLTQLAVMWLLRALLHLHQFARHLWRAARYFDRHRPDAVVLIDFPGFNWWIARCAKRRGIPVFYYAPPQVWAWARWRVKKMRRYVDHVLCSLPFEQQWYQQHGCRAVLVGHPYFDEVHHRQLDAAFVCDMRSHGRLVTILPGSRTQEVKHNLRWLYRAAQRVRQAVPDVRLAVAAFKPEHARFAAQMARQHGLEVEVHVGRTPELIHAAHCCMAVSGSVSLELLYHARPTVILYWITRTAYVVQSFFRKVKYITLVNLLACDDAFGPDLRPYDPAAPGAQHVLFPEYLTCRDRSPQIAEHVVGWLTDPTAHAALVARLRQLRDSVCRPGAARTAAAYILQHAAPARRAAAGDAPQPSSVAQRPTQEAA
jgi:lipid-A-disaccharide synthase